MSVTFDEPGRYRVVVDENGDSRVIVRRGRAGVATNGKQIAVENSEIRVYGIDSPRYEIVGLPANDAFDGWVAERDDRYERSYTDAYRYASEDILGVEELSRWPQGHSRLRLRLDSHPRGGGLVAVQQRPLVLAGSVGLVVDQ